MIVVREGINEVILLTAHSKGVVITDFELVIRDTFTDREQVLQKQNTGNPVLGLFFDLSVSEVGGSGELKLERKRYIYEVIVHEESEIVVDSGYLIFK